MKRLAIITTHPIQYYAPIFRLLQERGRIAVKVFYTAGQPDATKFDPGFNRKISWDIPLLDGYDYEWVPNTSTEPGSYHYKGIINPTLIGQVKDWKPDAVLFFGWAYSGHLKAMRFFKGKLPVYFRGDSTILNEKAGLRGLFKYLFLKWVYRHTDHAFYVGKNNKAYFRQYGLKEKQLSFAPHAVDNSRFEADHRQTADELRLSRGIKKDDILILYAGKFEQVKNVGLLLSAFVQMDRQNVHLLLTGNGQKEQQLKAQAASSPAAARVHFLDFQNQSNMPALYQAADLFCLPSFSETWGLSVNEAMACQNAVLVSDKVGCAADLVKPDFNGAVFASDDPADLLACLTKMTSSREQLRTFGKNSALMVHDWSFLAIAQEFEQKITNEEIRLY